VSVTGFINFVFGYIYRIFVKKFYEQAWIERDEVCSAISASVYDKQQEPSRNIGVRNLVLVFQLVYIRLDWIAMILISKFNF
jgi:hypothetical protein